MLDGCKLPDLLKYHLSACPTFALEEITMAQVLKLPNVLTLEEAARYLRISKETAKRLAGQGTIPGRCLDGR